MASRRPRARRRSTLFRHTALFLLRPETTSEQRTEMLRGLASLPESCSTVRALEFGDNALADARLPRAYDIALHLDFDDAEGYGAYFADPRHTQVAEFNASISIADRTARVDWLHDGEPAGPVRHVAAFVWGRGRPRRRSRGRGVARRRSGRQLGSRRGARRTDSRAWDWLLDLVLDDLAAARAPLEGPRYREVMEAVGPAVVAGATAHVTHLRRPA